MKTYALEMIKAIAIFTGMIPENSITKIELEDGSGTKFIIYTICPDDSKATYFLDIDEQNTRLKLMEHKP